MIPKQTTSQQNYASGVMVNCFPPNGTERFLISEEFMIGCIPPSTTEQLPPMPSDIAVSGYSSCLDDDYDPDDMQAGSEPDDEFESDLVLIVHCPAKVNVVLTLITIVSLPQTIELVE